MKTWLAMMVVAAIATGWFASWHTSEELFQAGACTQDNAPDQRLELPPRERMVTHVTYVWPEGELLIRTRSQWSYELEDVPVDLAVAFLEVEDKEMFFYHELKDAYVVSVQATGEEKQDSVQIVGATGAVR